MRFDIITFGSATRDTFLVLKNETDYIVKDPRLIEKKAFHFPFGSKIDIKRIMVFSGGGGTNAAATFSKQMYKVAYVGKVGEDKRGEAVIEELNKLGVYTGFIRKDKKRLTAFSLIISSARERTIFVYRGASHYLKTADIPWDKLSSKWFYLGPLSGETNRLFGDIVNFAVKKGIKIACNPGNSQINLGIKKLKPILEKIDILSLNQEEASLLTRIPYWKESSVIKKLSHLCPGILIITKGKNGAVLFDGEFIYRAPVISNIKICEKTGAGDAFSAGFLASYIRTNDIVRSLQFATANANYCIKEMGAKNGLLKKGEKYQKVKIKKSKIK